MDLKYMRTDFVHKSFNQGNATCLVRTICFHFRVQKKPKLHV